jgi:hypothetical protein
MSSPLPNVDLEPQENVTLQPKPTSRSAALKMISLGIALTVAASAVLYFDVIPIFAVAAMFIFGPMLILFGGIAFLLPARLHGSRLHNRLTEVGAIAVLIAIIGLVAWYLFPMIVGR